MQFFLFRFFYLSYFKSPKWTPLSHVTIVTMLLSISLISRGEKETSYKVVDHFCIDHITDLFTKTPALF